MTSTVVFSYPSPQTNEFDTIEDVSAASHHLQFPTTEIDISEQAPITPCVPDANSQICGSSQLSSHFDDLDPHGYIGPWVSQRDRVELRKIRTLDDLFRDNEHPQRRFIRRSEMFDVQGFEDWVQGVKRKSELPFHEHRNFQSDDDDYVPVFANTAVSNGLHFDSSGCLMSTRQRHNSDPSASVDPKDVAPNDVPLIFSSTSALPPDISYEELPSIASTERKILPLPKRREGVSQAAEYRHPELQLAPLGPNRESAPPNKKARMSPVVQNTPPCNVSVSSETKMFGPKARANPESELIDDVSSFTPKLRAKSSRDYVRASTVSSDTTETSTSSESNDYGTFQCYSRSCRRFFESLDDVKEHFRAEHLPGTNQLRCAYVDCSKITNSLGDMGRHELALAHKAPSFQCHSPSCGKVFTRKDALKRHWNRLSGHESQSRRAEKARTSA